MEKAAFRLSLAEAMDLHTRMCQSAHDRVRAARSEHEAAESEWKRAIKAKVAFMDSVKADTGGGE